MKFSNIGSIVSPADKINIQPKSKTYSCENVRKASDFFETTQKRTASKSYTSNPVNLGLSPHLLFRIYNNKNYIKNLIEKNPKIEKILNSVGIKNPEICTDNLSNISNSHIVTTTAYALQIANQLGLSAADKKALEQAAVFHDFGKVLIPEKIINKPGKLDENERKIINAHTELGAELLETAGMSKVITNLIRNHHNPKKNDLLGNILAVADIYSALREERCYKKTMSAKSAISILDKKAENGELNTNVVHALEKIS